MHTQKNIQSFIMLVTFLFSLLSACFFPEEKQVTLYFSGDLMQHTPQIKSAQTANGGYDYSDCFAYVKDDISDADIAIANLEVPLGGKPYSGYPRFCAPDEYAQGIKEAGFDIVMTTNNHTMDKGRQGAERTLDMLDSLGLAHFGTYRNLQERTEVCPLLVEKNGIKIAFIGYTYGTNGLPVTPPVVVDLIDREQIAADIQAAKNMGADAIIACMHWGVEYKTLPEQSERELAQWMLSQGVDHIVGTHPHVIQPIEVHAEPSDSTDKHVIAYSLGNYISNQSPATTKKAMTDGGAALRLTLTKNQGVTKLSDCSYSLIWVSRPQVSGKKNYRIIPANADAGVTGTTEKGLMNTYLNKARKLYKDHNIGIYERNYQGPKNR